MFSPIKYQKGVLSLLDQKRLPFESVWIDYLRLDDAAIAIEQMVVRGAPAIGCTAAFALAMDAANFPPDSSWQKYKPCFLKSCERLARTRPTAVNLFFAIDKMKTETGCFHPDTPMPTVVSQLEKVAQRLFDDDLRTCQAIGKNGAALSGSKAVSILTHCNAGGLATAGFGTALGVIRTLHDKGLLKMTFIDETRPFLQGARLTAWELLADKIPCTLIVDSVGPYLMQQGAIDMVIVGADRIAKNGDTANKIGTYSLAVSAKYHQVPFYIAAPTSTFDLSLTSGEGIPIEKRDSSELTTLNGQPIAPAEINTYNPSFDVTPSSLITGIITEYAVLTPPFNEKIANLFQSIKK